jgi:hypothetical protein
LNSLQVAGKSRPGGITRLAKRRFLTFCEIIKVDTLNKIGTWVAGKEASMLWTIFVILLVLWVLGLMSGYTMGGVIHLLLVIAIVVIVFQLISGRRRL